MPEDDVILRLHFSPFDKLRDYVRLSVAQDENSPS